MPLRLFNTLSRALETFEPIEPGRVRMYTCGPTVYNRAHIGNFRAYMFEDLLRRHLKWSGFQVVQVMNLTDVDDKTIRASIEEKIPLKEFTKRYIDAFFQDIAVLGIERAEHYPAATDHIPEMIEMIRVLMEKGIAYRSDDGSVYFSIQKFPKYGALARLDRAGLRPGARVAQDEFDKEDAADFALWKAWSEKDGDVWWDSPWGRGRPGWHIECSAMSIRYLGPSFDIHCGGVDNIFPHHECEIAQSESVTGQPFVRYWLHCAHLIVDGRKMSKSLGNFLTLDDLLREGFSGREIRYQLLATHYRQTLNFTREGLHAARAALQRVDEFTARLRDRAGRAAAGPLPAWAVEGREAFRAAMDDDLNISGALAALFDLLRAGNKALDEGSVSPDAAAATLEMLADLDRVLGVLTPSEAAPDAEVLELVERRQAARAAKNWAESDRLRNEIIRRGWVVQDTPQGPKLRRAT
ncbi:MAG: cysteine--tRNA ligase [Kiritimatiellae bacterium]|nr:cysteine--tRNA ligase [Kiritimatiellia bacterium]MDW8458104.1 cysteine--tRNA ligase [Verrucomicrobiota bacterium]